MMESVCRLAKRALGGGRVVVGRGACGGPGIFPFSARADALKKTMPCHNLAGAGF